MNRIYPIYFAAFLALMGCGRENTNLSPNSLSSSEAMGVLQNLPESASDSSSASAEEFQDYMESLATNTQTSGRGFRGININFSLLRQLLSLIRGGRNTEEVARTLASSNNDVVQTASGLQSILDFVQSVLPFIQSFAPRFAQIAQAVIALIPSILDIFNSINGI